MSPNRIAGAVEFADDLAQRAIEDATSAVAAAETEARYDTTRGEVLDHMSMNFTDRDDKVFMRALRQEERQDLGLMLDLIQRSFKAVVAKKKSAILARKPEPNDLGDEIH